MVRDPIEKAISWYYYIRSAPYLANVMKKIDPNGTPPDTKWLEKVNIEQNNMLPQIDRIIGHLPCVSDYE